MSFNVTKDPQADLDYTIDWTAWLDGDTILTSTWSVTAPAGGMTTHSASINGTSKTTTVWLAGGTAPGRYAVVNHIVTVGNRVDERSILVAVYQK